MTISPATLFVFLFAVVNALAFLFMLWDKTHATTAQSGRERVPEGLLFFLATCFGALGVYAGMFAFRHKTRKWYFVVGIPLLIVQNIVTLLTVAEYFNK